MKKLSIILFTALVSLAACTKSKEVHPEIGDGNDEIVTVGMKDVHVKYTRTDHAELNRVVFHYCPADANGNAQQFAAAEMTKKETLFELTLNDLLSDTLYWYYYELFPVNGDAFNTLQKTFHTQTFEQPGPPTPPVAELPTVVTGEVSEITANSAQCGGDVMTYDGGATVIEFGICWSTNANPTLDDSHVAVGTGIGHFFASMTNLEANTTYHVRAYAINEVGTAYGQDVEFTTLSAGGSGEHEYVDLGLPSGTLWATCNVGANAPEEYGDYFAWGETWPKDYYDWSNYQYCRGSAETITKYCDNANYGYNGYTDNLNVLQDVDDAATMNWGNGWYMPTVAQWDELLQNTSSIWTTQNGVTGRRFTASNGNSFFLPAAGSRWGDILYNAGSYGNYWSSSLITDYPNYAYYFGFYSDYNGLGNYTRSFGFPIRPVRSSN